MDKTGSCPAYGKLCNSFKKNDHCTKYCKIKKVNCVQKYQGGFESDKKSKIFENEASFIVAVSNEDFTPFENYDNEYTAKI